MSSVPRASWIIVVLAAVSMVATLPGRTVGLGLITEPLLGELQLERTDFARMNLVATLVGSLFALAAGPLIDRWGIRLALFTTLLLFGTVVMTMSQWVTAGSIMLFLILTRGLGQSALSTVSVTSVGRRFKERLAMAIGIFSIIVALGFVAAIVSAQSQVATVGWRQVWLYLGATIAALGFLCFVAIRTKPDDHTLKTATATTEASSPAFTLPQALRTPCFWIFSLGMAFYAGLFAAVSLFNESILQELGFGQDTFRAAMASLMGAGLLGNGAAAWASKHCTLPRIMALSLALLGLGLAGYAHLQTPTQVCLHAGLYGFCGGIFSVLFFTGFGQAFGAAHLGKIQGSAQMLTVIASALGPWWLASQQAQAGSYFPAMKLMIPIFALLALGAWFAKLPSPEEPELQAQK